MRRDFDLSAEHDITCSTFVDFAAVLAAEKDQRQLGQTTRTTTRMMYKKKNHTTTNLAELLVLAQDKVHELFVLDQDKAHELLVHVMGRRRGEQR